MSNTRTTNRAARGGMRNDSEDPETQQLWEQIKDMMRDHDAVAEKIKANNARILSAEAGWMVKAKAEIPLDEVQTVNKLYRTNVTLEEQRISMIQGNDDHDGIQSKLQLLAALKKHNEQNSQNGRASSKRGTTLAKPISDMDGAADSAASSPAVDGKPRNARPPKMSSQPPKEAKEALVKREDSEAPDVPVKTGKVVFALGAEVAFKPKSANEKEETDWIQGTVVKVIGEGKSRRYDVQDPEPDEKTGKQAIIRTWASSMVTIPPLGAPLPEYPKGKHVLARYPDTTTFYRAEVAGNIGNEVMLKFEGEEDKERVLNVDRRFVLDHRG